MITVENLSRRWPEFRLRRVSLRILPGEYVVVLGPTGAGKTLLLELLAGVHAPDRGRILIDGQDVTDLPPEARRIGMVYQDFLLFPHLDVAGNIAYGLRYSSIPAGEIGRKVRRVAELLGIAHLLHRYPGTLSGGEQQRVAIGRALVTRPRVLFLDEPFSALDRRTGHRLRTELKQLQRREQITVVHVSHDHADARILADRVAVIRAGRLEAVGTPDAIFRRPPTRFVAEFTGAPNLLPVRLEAGPGGTTVRSGPFAVDVAEPLAGKAHLLVQPDEIHLARGGSPGTQNRVAGKVAGLLDEGGHIAVQVRVPGLPRPLAVHLTRQAFRELGLGLGDEVTADAADALHVVPG